MTLQKQEVERTGSTRPERRRPSPSRETFADVLRNRAACEPDAVAYTYLLDGLREDASLSNAGLYQAARAVATEIEERGATGAPVLLMFPPGLAFVSALYGCFLAGAIAVPAYPPSNTRHLPRLEAVAVNACAKLALTTSPAMAAIQRNALPRSQLGRMTWVATDSLPSNQHLQWSHRPVHRDSLALLQYTSGSTGEPRGVMLTHGQLMINAENISRWLELPAFSRPGVTWLPPYHDLGLMGGVLHPLYDGFRAIMMSPLSFLQCPSRWLSAIANYRATVSGAPNFAYDLVARSLTEDEKATLDLSCWNAAFCGAEPIRPATVERFARALEPCGFRRDSFFPGYGLAEATLMVCARARGQPPRMLHFVAADLERHVARLSPTPTWETRTLVSCGAPPAGQTIRIVDPESKRTCAPGRVGEIWVHGPNVSAGYWQRPAETEAALRAFTSDTSEGPFLRTGDLGIVEDGELVVTGRLKDLIVIDGRNHYPQDIERTIEACHLAVRPGACAAFSLEVDGREALVVAVECERWLGGDALELKTAIRRAVSTYHSIQARDIRLVRRGSIPTTSSGKVQRHACKRAYLESTLREVG